MFRKNSQQDIVRKQCNIGKYEKFESNTSWNANKQLHFCSENINLCQTNIHHNPIYHKSHKTKCSENAKVNSVHEAPMVSSNDVKKKLHKQLTKDLKQKTFTIQNKSSHLRLKLRKRVNNENFEHSSFESPSNKLATIDPTHKNQHNMSSSSKPLIPQLLKTDESKPNNFFEFRLTSLNEDLDKSLDLLPLRQENSLHFLTSVAHDEERNERHSSLSDKKLNDSITRCLNPINGLPLPEDFTMQDLDVFDTVMQSRNNQTKNDHVSFSSPSSDVSKHKLLTSTSKQYPGPKPKFKLVDEKVSSLYSFAADESSCEGILVTPPVATKKVKFDFMQNNTYSKPQLSSDTFSSDDGSMNICELLETSDTENEKRNKKVVAFRSIDNQDKFYDEPQGFNVFCSKSARTKSKQALVDAVTDAVELIDKMSTTGSNQIPVNNLSSVPSSDEEDILHVSLNRHSFTSSQFAPLGLSIKLLRLHRILQTKNDEERENIMCLHR